MDTIKCTTLFYGTVIFPPLYLRVETLVVQLSNMMHLVYTEKVQSQGRVDCIVETPRFVYIFEFKLDGTADEALRQIADKGYDREYDSGDRKIYKIGCSFSSETGTIDDWKVC